MSNKKATYGAIKPYSENDRENDAVQTIVLNEVIKKLQDLGLAVEEMHEIRYDVEHLNVHYYEHIGRTYFPKLVNCMSLNKVIGLVIINKNHDEAVVDTVRSVAGSTIKVDKETGEVTRLPEPGTIRYNCAFKVFQMRNGVKEKDVVIPENLDGCELKFDAKAERVDIFKNGVKICEMYMTQNFIHTSSSVADAENEINNFLDQYEVNKQQELSALKAHAKSKNSPVK